MATNELYEHWRVLPRALVGIVADYAVMTPAEQLELTLHAGPIVVDLGPIDWNRIESQTFTVESSGQAAKCTTTIVYEEPRPNTVGSGELSYDGLIEYMRKMTHTTYGKAMNTKIRTAMAEATKGMLVLPIPPPEQFVPMRPGTVIKINPED